MADAGGMHLVFHLGGSGFALPIRDLIEVAEVLPGQVEARGGDTREGFDGWIERRGDRVPLFSLARRLRLPELLCDEPFAAVVMTGADGPWAVRVDAVEGIFPAGEFALVAAPAWMFQVDCWPFARLALWRGQPLVHCDALALEARWGAA